MTGSAIQALRRSPAALTRRFKQTTRRSNFARVGPVHFQPLEWELEPVLEFMRGRLLNAGCGDRDLGDLFRANGISEVVNYDIASSLQDAICGSLEQMPFGDESFDSILCNAVLEHVVHIDEVMNELARVLRVDGHAVISIPFLQPFHACPTDFRRFTCDGIRQLATLRGLDVIAVYPVHSITQTVCWIVWQHLLEKKSRLRSLAYPILWAATRFHCRSDHTAVTVANTFQMVCRKAESVLALSS
jgi:SAM-dependent methyltransferase